MAKQVHPTFIRSEWIYDWKQATGSRLGSVMALLLVSALFALFALLLRVKVSEPVEWSAPQASVIQLGQGEVGRLLAMKALADGPFPSRFEPDRWQGSARMSQDLTKATEVVVPVHQPMLLPFPEPQVLPLRLARRGEPVLPASPADAPPDPDVTGVKLMPVLSVLDGIEHGELPEALPAWSGPIPERLAGRSWKFLVEIEDSGRVRDCVVLAGGGELGPAELADWLRACIFRVKPREEGRRWVAVALDFENRMTKHGADTQ